VTAPLTASSLRCRVCDAPATILHRAHPGYAHGSSYDIYECTGCGSSFAEPLRSDAKLYDRIYRAIDRIPGYERYERYAKRVRRARSPLRTLATHEDVYYAIAEILRALHLPKTARLLEVGSGLGYLTYSLARAGYRIEGWDVSEDAVQAARERFGPYFAVRDVNALQASSDSSRYDVVILTELIEHLEDPVAFVRASAALLAPGGALLMTTPNKNYYPDGVVWHTDLPPIHLWWFTERAMREMGERCRLDVRYYDFTEYNRERPWESAPVLPAGVPTYAPVFDEAGNVVANVTPPERRRLFPLNRSLIIPAVTALRRARRLLKREKSPLYADPRGRRPTMAVLARHA
jgi:SAM-dependent methyltransferase